MATKQIFRTPIGTAFFPYLHTPETYEGNEIGYTCKIILSQDETVKLEEFLMKELEKAKTLEEFQGKKWSSEPLIGTGETKEGETYFKFKKKASYKSRKTGEEIRTTVPLFDAKGKPLPKNIMVGNNSRIRVAYSITPFHMNKNNNGLSLRLEGVQIIELHNNETTAESLGFGIEDGYEAPQSVEDVLTEDTNAEDGDF